MELSGSNIKKCLIFQETGTLKNFLYFLKRMLFWYFWKQTSRKVFWYFWKRNFLTLQETETLKNFWISGSNFPSSKNEKKIPFRKRLIFAKLEFLALSLKTCYTSGENFKVPSLKKSFMLLLLFFKKVNLSYYSCFF